MKWWNNGIVNKRSKERPNSDFVEGRLPFPRQPCSEEKRNKIKTSLKGRVPWNKGKTNVYSEETLKKMSEAKSDYIPWNKGTKIEYDIWNKGLSKETDERIAKYAATQTGQTREGNYFSPDKWKGEGNYWYGKSRSGELSPRYKGEVHRRDYKDYRNKVGYLTEQNYAKNIDIINPNGYPRTVAGVEGGYQLDHICPVIYGFENNIPPEEIASVENLQMLPWEQNRLKGYKYEK